MHKKPQKHNGSLTLSLFLSQVRAADMGTMAQLQLQIDDLECTAQLYTSWQTQAKF